MEKERRATPHQVRSNAGALTLLKYLTNGGRRGGGRAPRDTEMARRGTRSRTGPQRAALEWKLDSGVN